MRKEVVNHEDALRQILSLCEFYGTEVRPCFHIRNLAVMALGLETTEANPPEKGLVGFCCRCTYIGIPLRPLNTCSNCGSEELKLYAAVKGET